MNLSPVTKKRNCGLSELEWEEQEVSLWSTPPEQTEGKKRSAENPIGGSQVLAVVLQVRGRKIHLKKVLMEFDFELFPSLEGWPVSSACPCASPRRLT